jgi:hypothetical protein
MPSEKDKLFDQITENIAGTAKLVTLNMLQNDRTLGYAILEEPSQPDVVQGLVVVAANQEEARALLDFIRKRPGANIEHLLN